METERLIRGLSSDARLSSPRMPAILAAAVGASAVLAALVFFAVLGPRADIALAAATPRFLFKFVLTLALAATAVMLAGRASRPGAPLAVLLPFLAAVPLLAITAVSVEFVTVPPAESDGVPSSVTVTVSANEGVVSKSSGPASATVIVPSAGSIANAPASLPPLISNAWAWPASGSATPTCPTSVPEALFSGTSNDSGSTSAGVSFTSSTAMANASS